MKCMLLSEYDSDLKTVLESCGVEITQVKYAEANATDISSFDTFCILADGSVLDPRFRIRLEKEIEKGKRIFTEALNSWMGIYSADPVDTTRSRLVVIQPENGELISGLQTGDLLDDKSNKMMQPWYSVPGLRPLLVYKDHIIAHRHINATKDEILNNSKLGLWMIGENVMMSSFTLHNFNKARFAPRDTWWKVISFIARWITGNAPKVRPNPVVWHNYNIDLSDDKVFEKYRKDAIHSGINWLTGFLVDNGYGGIREGLRHNIDSDGIQTVATSIRSDCSGEAAGAFRMFGDIYNNKEYTAIAERLNDFVMGPMTVKGGVYDGMIRWTHTAWQVCYQDDAARAILPILFECLFTGNMKRFPDVCRSLNFLVKTTAQDGCRVARTDIPYLTEKRLANLSEAEHGLASAHYNAYYHAALLLAYKIGGNPVFLDVGKKGLETIMSLYPETKREQSETEEMCRLILPLAALYSATKDNKHLDMLLKVTHDLEIHRHESGGFLEWDTGYHASCSRESHGECSILTENGDPVADLLYSINWLPTGFAYAYHVTHDKLFLKLWREIVSFFVRTQIHSNEPKTDGSWCRAFDLDLGEVYSCPHDIGWASCCSETGWTEAEILMGMMLPDYIERNM